VFTTASLFVLGLFFCFVYFLIVVLVSSGAVDCLERLVSEMTFYVSNATLNPIRSVNVVSIFTQFLCHYLGH